MDSYNKIHVHPCLKMLIVSIVGIIVADFMSLNLELVHKIFLWSCVTLSFVCTAFIKQPSIRSIYFYLTLLLFTFAIHSHSIEQREAPYDTYASWTMVIDKACTTNNSRWIKTSARLSHYKLQGEDSWQRIDGKVVVYADSSIRVNCGDQLSFKGRLNQFKLYEGSELDKEALEGYFSLMNRRDFLGNVFIYENSLISQSSTHSSSFLIFFAKLQQRALQKLSRLSLSPSNMSIAQAMILGYKANIDNSLTDSYSRVGASHILAVSGLHVGIIFAFINLLLYPLSFLSSGHRLINILSVICIWIYALLTGLSLSVVRAAIMFSVMQFALFESSRTFSLNTLSATALVMLLLNTNSLFDISFLLSFVAVFFIITCFNPLFRLVRTHNKWMDAFLSVFLVGLIASLATLGLVSNYFHNMPLVGILIGPCIILLANFILLFGIAWILCPFALLQDAFSFILNSLLNLQNGLIDHCSTWSISNLRYEFSALQMAGYYIIAVSLAMWLWYRKPNTNPLITYDDDK